MIWALLGRSEALIRFTHVLLRVVRMPRVYGGEPITSLYEQSTLAAG